MKILHIITSSKCWAGMEQYAYDISKANVGIGNTVIFVIANDGEVVAKRLKKLGKIYRLSIRSKFDIKSIFHLRKIINNEKPDVIHTHQPKNIFQAYFARGKHKNISIVHSVHFLINTTSPHFLYKWGFNKTTSIIAVSEIVRKRFLEIYPNIKPSKIITVLSSVDSLRCVSKNINPKDNNTICIGYAGRIVAEKGVENIIEAVSLMLLEYMANGKPIITTNNGGQPEIIDSGKNGFLIKLSDTKTLAENMRMLIINKKLREDIGKEAKYKFNNQLSFKKFIRETALVYKRSII
ncbi:MAG: glycosyltransferase [Bacteroidetes bacterium]|nr:glycosyltransferase [Bacteroidota bacterium]